ncbi:bifunctional 5,10-methylenetetrahydrofolate dehydrogenase/5,10-methenyltetrahydrofolate cyclohydrolase [Candidatus Woesearchaeota archaeon]|nr:bifunctional 5,10-methylenetetrahydrofolate dehydrogenase/5,10-methenyltetrahydrofolate cyclohydrolase [Candidatus Woesearchaeota archaeon]
MHLVLRGTELAKRRLIWVKESLDEQLHLALVSFTDDPAYLQSIRNACQVAGVKFSAYRCAARESSASRMLHYLNYEPSITGVLVQTPIPRHIEDTICYELERSKDVDCQSDAAIDFLQYGKPLVRPTAASAVLELLDEYGITLQDKSIGILGAGRVGHQLSELLRTRGAWARTLPGRTSPPEAAELDIIVSTIPKPHSITPAYCRGGSILIDVASCTIDGKACGSFHPDCYAKAAAYTPVPGGVGPVTVAVVLENIALQRQLNKPH